MGLPVVRCLSVIILAINKLGSRLAVVQFRNHSYDYRPNRTPLSPITIINQYVWTAEADSERRSLQTKSHLNPFTPESDQCQISPAASPEILHHTVRRTWLFIAYSDEKWLYYKFSLHHSYNRFLKIWENTLFELRSERVKNHLCSAASCESHRLQSIAILTPKEIFHNPCTEHGTFTFTILS